MPIRGLLRGKGRVSPWWYSLGGETAGALDIAPFLPMVYCGGDALSRVAFAARLRPGAKGRPSDSAVLALAVPRGEGRTPRPLGEGPG